MGHGGDGGNVRSPAAQMRGDHGERGFIAAAPEHTGIDSKPSGQRVARHGPQTGKPHGQRDERAGVGRDDDAAPSQDLRASVRRATTKAAVPEQAINRFGDAEPVPQPRRERLFPAHGNNPPCAWAVLCVGGLLKRVCLTWQRGVGKRRENLSEERLFPPFPQTPSLLFQRRLCLSNPCPQCFWIRFKENVLLSGPDGGGSHSPASSSFSSFARHRTPAG